MEKWRITHARELCQLNGIEIYPADRGWSTKIIVKIGKKEKVSKDNYIAPTVKVNGKWVSILVSNWMHLEEPQLPQAQKRRLSFNPSF